MTPKLRSECHLLSTQPVTEKSIFVFRRNEIDWGNINFKGLHDFFCFLFFYDYVTRVRESQLRESYVLKYGDKVEGIVSTQSCFDVEERLSWAEK